MVTAVKHLERLYPLAKEIEQAIDTVLSSDEDSCEVSIYDLCYAIAHRLDYVFRLGVHLHKDDLDKPTHTFFWTPMHVAVISGNDKALGELIKAGAKLDVFDKRQWTPLHHATLLERTEQIQMLFRAGANPNCETLTGGTCQDISRCLEPVDKDDSTLIPLLGEQGSKRLTHGEYKQLTGATFLLETHLTPEMMWGEWKDDNRKESKFLFDEKFVNQYRQFCENPAVHRLKKVTQSSNGAALVLHPGFGIFASRDYASEEMIGEYKGLFKGAFPANPYALLYGNGKGIDALSHRNEIAQMNDGFPNAVLIPGRCIAGLSSRYLFVTAEKIKAGNQLCWNYGFTSFLKMMLPYVELRLQEMRAFIQQHKLVDLVLTFSALNRNSSFNDYVKTEKFRYVLQTPSVIFLMIFDGTITEKDGKMLLEISVLNKCISEKEMTPPLRELPDVAHACTEMRKRLQKIAPCISKKYEEWISSLPARAGLMCAFKMAIVSNAFLHEVLEKVCNGKINSEDALFAYWSVLESSQLEDIRKFQAQLKEKFQKV